MGETIITPFTLLPLTDPLSTQKKYPPNYQKSPKLPEITPRIHGNYPEITRSFKRIAFPSNAEHYAISYVIKHTKKSFQNVINGVVSNLPFRLAKNLLELLNFSGQIN